MGVGETGVGETGQIIGEMGVGETGVGETGTNRLNNCMILKYKTKLSNGRQTQWKELIIVYMLAPSLYLHNRRK